VGKNVCKIGVWVRVALLLFVFGCGNEAEKERVRVERGKELAKEDSVQEALEPYKKLKELARISDSNNNAMAKARGFKNKGEMFEADIKWVEKETGLDFEKLKKEHGGHNEAMAIFSDSLFRLNCKRGVYVQRYVNGEKTECPK